MKLDYCTECGKALTQRDETHYICEQGHMYYNNPRAAVGVILINNTGEILFAKRAGEPQKDKYDFPGGFLNFGEDTRTAAVRELQEEAGIQLGELTLLDCAPNHYMHNVTTTDVLYTCTQWAGELKPADDVAAFEWYPIDFMDSEQFAWREGYHHAYTVLKEQLGESTSDS